MKEVMAMAEGKMQIPPKVYSIAEERGWGGSVWIDKTSVPWYSQAGRYVYRDGLVTTAGWRGPLLFIRVAQPWREVATMRHGRRITLRYDRDHGSVITYKSGRFDFTFVDGSSAGFYVGWMPDRTLASDYFRYGVSEDRSVTPLMSCPAGGCEGTALRAGVRRIGLDASPDWCPDSGRNFGDHRG
jgi:hypothetical protein